MKIYTQLIDLKDDVRQNYFVPPHSNYKLGVKVVQDVGYTVKYNGLPLPMDDEPVNGYSIYTLTSSNPGKRTYVVECDNGQKIPIVETTTKSTVYDIDVGEGGVAPEGQFVKKVNDVVPVDGNVDVDKLKTDEGWIDGQTIVDEMANIHSELNIKANTADIPTRTSDLENDSGFLTDGDIPTKTSELENDSGFITIDDVEIPSKTSELENDSGFITIDAVPTKTSELENDSNFQSAEQIDEHLEEVLQDYAKSEELPTKVSELENDLDFADKEYVNDADKELSDRIDLIQVTSRPNMTVIGNPSFTQGNVSGFSENDYLMFPTSVNVGKNSVDFYISFSTGDNISRQQNLMDSWCGLAFAINEGGTILAVSTDGIQFNSVTSSNTIEPNTSYRAKISFSYSGGMYFVNGWLADGAGEYTISIGEMSMSSPIHPTATYWGGANPESNIPHIFDGTINLNECWMSWNGEVVWRGYDELPIPTKVSQLENDVGYITDGDINKITSEDGNQYINGEGEVWEKKHGFTDWDVRYADPSIGGEIYDAELIHYGPDDGGYWKFNQWGVDETDPAQIPGDAYATHLSFRWNDEGWYDVVATRQESEEVSWTKKDDLALKNDVSEVNGKATTALEKANEASQDVIGMDVKIQGLEETKASIVETNSIRTDLSQAFDYIFELQQDKITSPTAGMEKGKVLTVVEVEDEPTSRNVSLQSVSPRATTTHLEWAAIQPEVVPTKLSELENDSGYQTSDDVDTKIDNAIGKVLTQEEF